MLYTFIHTVDTYLKQRARDNMRAQLQDAMDEICLERQARPGVLQLADFIQDAAENSRRTSYLCNTRSFRFRISIRFHPRDMPCMPVHSEIWLENAEQLIDCNIVLPQEKIICLKTNRYVSRFVGEKEYHLRQRVRIHKNGYFCLEFYPLVGAGLNHASLMAQAYLSQKIMSGYVQNEAQIVKIPQMIHLPPTTQAPD